MSILEVLLEYFAPIAIHGHKPLAYGCRGVHCGNVAARVHHELSPSSSSSSSSLPKEAQVWGGANLTEGAFSGYSG
jgi:hypothetical protein